MVEEVSGCVVIGDHFVFVFDVSHVFLSFTFSHLLSSTVSHSLTLSLSLSLLPPPTDAIRSYDYALGPLLTPFIEESNDAVLVRAALRCFPAIRHSDPQKVMRACIFIY